MVINYSIVTDNQIIEAINNPEYKKNVVSIAKRLQVPYRRVMRLAEEVNIEGIVYQPIKRNYVSRGGRGYKLPEEILTRIRSKSFYDRYDGNPYLASKSMNGKPCFSYIRREWINMGYRVNRKNNPKLDELI